MLEKIINRYFGVILLVVIFIANANAEYNELKMVHVIFRHGQRTPTESSAHERYPKDPYLNKTYFPEGTGHLTNDGKLTMYKLGTFLRRRYNHFLGDLHYPGVTRVRSTRKERTMMSAQLVNAGLWPPTEAQQWNKNLRWIPIPYEYETSHVDSLMLSYECPTYKTEYEKIEQSEEVQKLIEPHLEFFAYLSEHTGMHITRPKQAFFLYHTLASEMNYNLTLPSWTNGYFPDGELYDVTLLEYDIGVWGDLLKRIYGGPLLREILLDYEKLIKNNSSSKFSPKMKMYSGHESNICSVLKALDLWTPHIPDFSAAIIFELHRNNFTNEIGIQILYFLGRSGETIPLTLPGCTRICPIRKFTQLLSKVIPDDVPELCGLKMKSVENRSSSVSLQMPFYITLQLLFLSVCVS